MNVGNYEDVMVFQAMMISNMSASKINHKPGPVDEEIMKFENAFSTVFRDDVPAGLLPNRDIDHHIKVLPYSSPPHAGILQLSPTESLSTKKYIKDLLRKGKIRQ